MAGKMRNQSIRLSAAALAGVSCLLGATKPVTAAVVTWSGTVDANWNTSTFNFNNGAAKYTNGDTVVFDDTAVRFGTIVVNGAVSTPASITFNNANPIHAYTLSGGAFTNSAPITVNGIGGVTLLTNNSTAYTGLITVNGLLTSNLPTFGSATVGTVVNSGGELALTGTGTLAEPLTLSGNGLTALGNTGGALQFSTTIAINGPISLVGSAGIWNIGSNTASIGGSITNAGVANATLTLAGINISNPVTMSGAINDGTGGNGTISLIKSGGAIGNTLQTGVYNLANANNYSGTTTVKVGTLGLVTIAGTPAVAGRSANSDFTVGDLAILAISNANYTGSTATRGKSLTLTGGLVTYTGAASIADVDTFTNALTIGTGGSKMTLTPGTSGSETAAFGSLVRSNAGATLLVRGAALNTAASPTSFVTFGTSPSAQLVGGGGAAGSTTVSIFPWITGDSALAGNGTSFVTYDAGGFRLLTSSEYSTLATAASGTSTNNNVSSSTASTMSANTTVNSLLISANSTIGINSGVTFNLNSGAVLSVTGVTGTIGNVASQGFLSFGGGSGEGIIGGSGNLIINAVVNTSGGLTLANGSGVSLAANNSSTTTGLRGTIYVNSGAALTSTLAASPDNAFGQTSNVINLSGNGRVVWNNNVSTARVIQIGDGGGTIDAGGAGTAVTLTSSVIATSGNLGATSFSKGGNAGTLVLAGSANAVGAIAVSAGSLRLASTGVIGMKGGLIGGSTASYVIDGGTVNDAQDAFSQGLVIRNSGVVTIQNGGVYNLTSPIVGGLFTRDQVSGAGFGTQTYPGLKIGAPTATGTTDVLNVTSGQLNLTNSADLSVADAAGAATLRTTTGTLNLSSGGSITIAGNDAAHGLKIGNANPFDASTAVTGAFNMTGGTLALTTGSGTNQVAPAFIVGVGTFSTGTLNAVGTFTQSGGTASTSGTVILGQNGSSNANLSGGTFTAAQAISLATNNASALSVMNISGSAIVTANGGLSVGTGGGVKGTALVQLSGGTLTTTSLAANAVNGSTYQSGFIFSGGTLNTAATSTNLGAVTASGGTTATLANSTTISAFTVGDGSGTSAILNFRGGTHTFTSGLAVASDGYLTGSTTAVTTGTGTIGIAAGAHVAPGSSSGTAGSGIGTLNLFSLDLSAATNVAPISLDFDFASPGTGSTNSDQIIVSGAGLLVLSSTANSLALNMSDAGALAAGTYKLFGYNTSFGGNLSSLFVNSSPLTSVSYAFTSTDSEIDLVVTAPEPTSLAVFGLGGGLILRRRRSRRAV